MTDRLDRRRSDGRRDGRRLAAAGEDVTVWNRTRAKAEALTEPGARSPTRIADLRDRDVVFTMVSTPADLEQVLTGEGGLLADADHVPGIVVDCSTVVDRDVGRDARGLRRARGRLPGRAGQRQRQGRRAPASC